MKTSTCILVADDDASALRNFSELLKGAGYKVLECRRGRESLESVRNGQPAVAILDVMLPDLSGIEVCRRIKEEAALVDTFVVLMSGAATRGGTRSLGLDQSSDAYMLKPTDGEEFLARTRTFVRLQATTAALRASERNYRELAENIREVFWITDAEKNKVIYVSPGYEQIWGRTCESLYESPRNWVEAIDPADRERVLAAALTKQVLGKYHEIYRIRRPDGSIRWIEDRAFPIRNESGTVTRVVGVADDITQRKRAEEALRESEMQKTAVMNSALDGIVTVDAQGQVTEFNSAAEKMFGCGRNQVIGRALAATLMPNSLRDWFARGLAGYFAAEEGPLGGRIETKAKRADGNEFAVEFTISRVNLEGAPVATIFIRDITARKRAEAQLAILAHAVECTADPICITDLKDRFTFVNRAFQKTYGYTEQEILGRTPEILFSPKNPTSLLNEVLAQTRGGGWRGEVLDKRKDGSELPISLSTSQIRDRSGEIVGLMGVATDISERKLTEKRNAAMSQLGYRLSEADTREEAAEIILSVGSELFGWDAGYVNLYSRHDDKTIPLLTVDTVNGKRERFAAPSEAIEPTPLMRRILEHGPELIEPSRAQKLGLKLVPFGNKSRRAACMMFAPIHANSAAVGLVSIQSYTSGAYNINDLNLLQSMADFCGGALLRIEVTQSLRLAEAKYRGIFENATEGIFQTTQDGRYLNANPALARMFGYESPAELIAAVTNIERQTFADPENAQQLKNLLAARDNVVGFEAQRIRKNGARFWTSINVMKVHSADGKFLYYEGTVQDITKRKRAEKENIALSRLGYGLSAAISAEQAANSVFDIASELFGWDAAYVHLYSKTEDKIIPILTVDNVEGKRETVRPETFTLDPSPLMRLVMKEGAHLYDSATPPSEAPALVPFGDTTRRSASRMYVAIHAGNEVVGILSIQSYAAGIYTRKDLALLQTMADYCGDAFRRIGATEGLRKAEQKYRSIFENATEGIFQSTPDGRIIAANQALATMFGYDSPEELMSSITNIGQQMYASPERRSEFQRLLETDGSVQDFAAEGTRKDGIRIWVHVNARAVRDERGHNVFYEGTARDITARKRSEEELRKLSRAVEQSPASVVITDAAGTIEHVNAKFTEITGYALAEVRGQNSRLLKSGWTPAAEYARLWQTITSGHEWRGEFHNRKKDGTFYWESASISPIFDSNGKITHFVAVKEDITERKRMEKKLVAFTNLEHQLSAAHRVDEAANIILEIAAELFGWDSGYVHLYSAADDQIVRVLTMDTVDGHRVATPPARPTSEPSPMMRLVMKQGPRLINRTDGVETPVTFYPFGDPSRHSASMMYAPIRSGGAVVGILSIQSYAAKAYSESDLELLQVMADQCGDALQRIKVGEALREAEFKYRSIFENATEGIFQSTPEGRIVGANPALARMYGYASPQEMMASINDIGRELYVLPQRRADLKRALEHDELVQGFEAENYQKDGRQIWISLNARAVRDPSGRVQFYEGTIQDITQNKLTQAILRESERKLRLISENATDAIFAFDMKRRAVYANSAVTELTGYTVAEIQERGFINWIHPDDQNQMLKLWEALYEGNGYSEVEFRLVTKSGQKKWCSSTWGPLYDEHGRQIGVQGRERDVTLRKQLESELLEISGTERRRIGHELHDGLGQYLAGIAFRAKALEQRLSIAGSPDAQDAKELVSLMNQAISQTRNLARGMAPVDVEASGLAAALQNLASETKHFFNCRCEVHCPNSDLQVDARSGLELYRIAQEAIHNAVRHGEATCIEIKLRVHDQMLCLALSDNGTGFELANIESSGMGLRLMNYRARSVGGSVKVSSRQGKGTTVNCVVPLVCNVPLANSATPTVLTPTKPISEPLSLGNTPS